MGGLLDGVPTDMPDGALGDWLRSGRPRLDAWLARHLAGRAGAEAGFGQRDCLAMVDVAMQMDRLRELGVDAGLMGLFFFDIRSRRRPDLRRRRPGLPPARPGQNATADGVLGEHFLPARRRHRFHEGRLR